MLWIAKLTITPLLVGLVSLVARRWGPAAGGLLLALPWMTGPILFFMALEKGGAFARDMATGVELGTVSIAAWGLGYATVARRVPWPFAVAVAATCYGLVGFFAGTLPVTAAAAAALAAAALIVAFALIAATKEPDAARFLPWWDIPARMAASAVLVALIHATAGFLGPRYSGVVATYPVIATVMTCFTHARWGAPAATRLIRAMLLSMLGFAAFFVVVAITVTDAPLALSFALATAATLVVTTTVVALARRRLV